MDIMTPAERSARMRLIRSKNTGQEMELRRMLHSFGYRYRLHASYLPGKPDIVFKSKRKAIFVHGCFWHQHAGCKKARLPKSKKAYWHKKLRNNTERDRSHLRSLRNDGWKILTVWECQINKLDLPIRLIRFLSEPE